MKKCFRCNIKKDLTEFYRHPKMPDGTVNKCKECNKKDVKSNYRKKRNYYNEYDKDRIRNNFDYIFLHRYSNMRQRIEGRTKRKYRCEGKEICNKKEFLTWCWSEKIIKQFIKIHAKWKKNNYPRKLAPSIDRIDNNKGYTIDNMQWITQSNNSYKYTK